MYCEKCLATFFINLKQKEKKNAVVWSHCQMLNRGNKCHQLSIIRITSEISPIRFMPEFFHFTSALFVFVVPSWRYIIFAIPDNTFPEHDTNLTMIKKRTEKIGYIYIYIYIYIYFLVRVYECVWVCVREREREREMKGWVKKWCGEDGGDQEENEAGWTNALVETEVFC